MGERSVPDLRAEQPQRHRHRDQPAHIQDHQDVPVGADPNHVTPSWDGSVLWVNNTGGSSLTPVSPRTGKPGRPVRVADPYNLYFTPDGKNALVMAEDKDRIDFRDPHTMRLRYSMHVPCKGVNHLDFTADGHFAVASCEFSARLLRIDVPSRKVVQVLRLGKPMSAPMTPPGRGYSMPQDVRLSANGEVFYVADMAANGIWLISAQRFRVVRFIRTGMGTHGFIVGRRGKYLYISNRGEGSISVLDFATGKIVRKWRIPGGGSPDMLRRARAAGWRPARQARLARCRAGGRHWSPCLPRLPSFCSPAWAKSPADVR